MRSKADLVQQRRCSVSRWVCVCVHFEASGAVSSLSLVENVCCCASQSDDIASNPSTLLQNPRGRTHCMLGKKLPAVSLGFVQSGRERVCSSTNFSGVVFTPVPCWFPTFPRMPVGPILLPFGWYMCADRESTSGNHTPVCGVLG